jgi:hypothetical protein
MVPAILPEAKSGERRRLGCQSVFSERFTLLSEEEQLTHFVALTLVAVSIALIMTPAAYHRMAEQALLEPRLCSASAYR